MDAGNLFQIVNKQIYSCWSSQIQDPRKRGPTEEINFTSKKIDVQDARPVLCLFAGVF
jgi:hypothetical protein